MNDARTKDREVDSHGNCSKCSGTHYGSYMCPMVEVKVNEGADIRKDSVRQARDTPCDALSTDPTTDEQRELINKLAKSISSLCHTVIARRLGQFFEVIGEELQKDKPFPPDIAQLMTFYSVISVYDLVRIQARHVERLQKKLPPLRDERPGYVPREG